MKLTPKKVKWLIRRKERRRNEFKRYSKSPENNSKKSGYGSLETGDIPAIEEKMFYS